MGIKKMSILKRNTKKDFEEIEPKEAFTILEKHRNDSDYVPLDVRTQKEYDEGHIENATFLNIKSKNFEEELSKLDKSKKYFVYCKRGPRSDKAAQLMKKHGFNEIYEIVGGFDKWKSKRLPVEK
jgi:rhodanese-related sulfurtransferase